MSLVCRYRDQERFLEEYRRSFYAPTAEIPRDPSPDDPLPAKPKP